MRTIKNIKIDVNKPIAEWYEALMKNSPKNDFIILGDNRDNLIWFITNITQFLARQGGNEVASIYGKYTTDLMSFIYQLNLSLPVGYEIGQKYASHALYDLLLNFETEPSARFIIWNDADHLYEANKGVFENIFKNMILAAYCNRNGISTLKEDRTPYKVDQRNIFVFNRRALADLEELLAKEYDIPSMREGHKVIGFNVVELVNSSDGF